MVNIVKSGDLLIIKGSFSCISGALTSKEMRGMGEKATVDKEKLDLIVEALRNLQFGELQITVHEGKIVQINKIEKKRFPA